MNEESVKKLRDAVLAPCDSPHRCALERLSVTLSSETVRSSSLSQVAKSVGFSLHEAYGIMDGWDDRAGHIPAFGYDYAGHDEHELSAATYEQDSQEWQQYAAGRRLGAQLWGEAHPQATG